MKQQSLASQGDNLLTFFAGTLVVQLIKLTLELFLLSSMRTKVKLQSAAVLHMEELANTPKHIKAFFKDLLVAYAVYSIYGPDQ